MKFECLKCGTCCRNIIIHKDGIDLGMMLAPEEVKLFPPGSVAPMWAKEGKGRSRPNRLNVLFYQLNLKCCPHLTNENRCRIYKRRPLVCRGHPLTLHTDHIATVDVHCLGCQKLGIAGSQGRPRETFGREIFEAQIMIIRRLAAGFLVGPSNAVYLYNLRTKEYLRYGSADELMVLEKKMDTTHFVGGK